MQIPFSCVAVDLISGESVLLNKGLVEPAVRASSTIPTVFKSVELDGKVLEGAELEETAKANLMFRLVKQVEQ